MIDWFMVQDFRTTSFKLPTSGRQLQQVRGPGDVTIDEIFAFQGKMICPPVAGL
jgi:hypothetical protein